MRYAFLLVVLAGAGLAVFSACGSSASKSGIAPATTAAPTTAATKAAAATAPAKPAASGKVPADACALLTLDEVRQVIPDAAAGKQSPQQGVPAGMTVIGCQWDSSQGIGKLDLTVSTLGQGVTADILKSSLNARIKNSKGHAVSGVGDVAVVWSPLTIATNAQALVNGLNVFLGLNDKGAQDKQAQVEILLKALAGRM